MDIGEERGGHDGTAEGMGGVEDRGCEEERVPCLKGERGEDGESIDSGFPWAWTPVNTAGT